MSAESEIFNDPRLEVHMRFICPECGKEYTSFKLWRIHLNEDHDYKSKTPDDFNFKQINDQYHECQVCNTWVENADSSIALLQCHRFLHLPFSRTYRCRYCTTAFTRKRALCEHLFRFHEKHVGKIDNGEVAVANARLKNPKLNPEFYLRFRCPQCGKFIERYQEWLSHIDKAHKATSTDLRLHRIIDTNNFYCMHCKKMLYTNEKSKLQRHRFQHLPYKEYFQCAYCKVKKAYKTELLRHFIYVHKREFEAAKPYIRIPNEWGSKPNEGLVKELEDLLKGRNPLQPKRKEIDLIQKALQESSIDLESEVMGTIIHKPQKSLKDFATSSTHVDPQRIAVKQDKQALEEFCSEVFEEIEKIENETDNTLATTKQKPSVAAKRKEAAASTAVTFSEEEAEGQEKLISVEIVTINNEGQQQDIHEYKSYEPPPKSIKIDPTPASAMEEAGEQDKLDESVVEAYIHYICPMCGLEMTDHMEWRRHVLNQHDMTTMVENNYKMIEDNSALCLNCMEVLPTQKYNELQRHRLTHTKYHNYLKCKICGLCKSRKPKIITHIEICHKETLKHKMNAGKYTCKNCGKKFITEGRWNKHRDQCKPTQEVHNNSEDMAMMEHLNQAWDRLRKIKAALDAKQSKM